MLKIEFDTTDFELAHGRKPRGIGGWAFSETRNPKSMEDVIWIRGTYTEAKKQLINMLKSEGVKGFFVVHVCT